MNDTTIRNELCRYAVKMVDNGLVVGPGGNLSIRNNNYMYLSPSGFAIEEIRPEQWVEVNISNGIATDDGLRPSSEMSMHLYAYRKNPSIGAIVHSHPTSCIAFTLIDKKLPIMFPDQAALVGETAYIPYILPTTDLLAEAVSEKVDKASSILLGNHGLVTTGRNLREAFYRSQIVDESCKIYMTARTVGPPSVLNEEQFKEIEMLESEEYRVKLLQKMEERSEDI